MIGQFQQPNQIVCEGKADETFLSRLVDSAGLNANVSCPKLDPDGAQGISAIRRRLSALQSTFGSLARVIVVVDSDNDPAAAFAAAQGEFRAANEINPNKQYPIPDAVNILTNGEPRTAIIQIPTHDIQGCLDTLLLASFEGHCGNTMCACVDAFSACLNAPSRGITNASKLRLRSLVASIVPRNPGISLSYLLEARNCPIPMNHPSFDDLIGRLRTLLA